jgi:hypothetical protein
MLGSLSEVENLGAWLTTVVARISLNMLHSGDSRCEQPLGVHVPEPIVRDGQPFSVGGFTVRHGRIVEIDFNAARLRELDLTILDD